MKTLAFQDLEFPADDESDLFGQCLNREGEKELTELLRVPEEAEEPEKFEPARLRKKM